MTQEIESISREAIIRKWDNVNDFRGRHTTFKMSLSEQQANSQAAIDALKYLGWLPPSQPFQSRANDWMQACFGPAVSSDKTERNHRFLEESLELVQSLGCTKQEVLQLVDYVYAREVGDPSQEVGGVVLTLAALCLAQDMDAATCGEAELARVWTKIEKIRAKQAAEPKNAPLSEASPSIPPSEVQAIRAAALEEAAELIKSNSECVSGNTSKRFLIPRHSGDLMSTAYADAIRTLSTAPPEYVVVKRGDIRAIERLLIQASQAKGDAILTRGTP